MGVDACTDLRTNCFKIVLQIGITLIGILVCLRSISGENICNDQSIGDFKFLDTVGGAEPTLFYYREDRVKVDCSTTLLNSTVHLQVKDYNDVISDIEYNKRFNKSLQRIGQVFTFVAELGQNGRGLWCYAKEGNRTICLEKGQMFIQKTYRVRPVRITPNITSITLELGDNYHVTCEAHGMGLKVDSYLKWYKVNVTGKYLVEDSAIERKGDKGIDVDVLMLRNMKSEMQGVYICERSVYDRIAPTNASFSVIFKVPEKPVVELIPNVRRLKVREFLATENVNCFVVRGSPKPSLAWYKHGKRIRVCNQSLNCELKISKAAYPDSGGNYSCAASNLKGSHSLSMGIIVLVSPSLEKQTTQGQGYAKVADVNQKAEIECRVKRSNPLPKFIWLQKVGNEWKDQFDKVTIYPDLSTPTNVSKLVVPPSNITALYSCIAKNEIGIDFLNITVIRKGGTSSLSTSKEDNKTLVIAISCSMVVILIVLMLSYCYKRRIEKRYGLYLQPNLIFEFDPSYSLQEQSTRLPYDPKWEFPRDRLILLETIGAGAFGEVWLAKAQGILEFKAELSNMSPTKQKRFSRLFSSFSNYHNSETIKNNGLTKVAVKTVKEGATDSDYKDLASELKVLIHIGEHQNIVNLLGACTRGGKLFVILEYCQDGDLSGFLRGKRDVFDASWTKIEPGLETSCTYYDLANISYQIARGMDFLASKQCVHRDLAARNVLVSKDHNDDINVKIADFGMARDVYRDGIYMKQSSGVLPLKWTAPESLADAMYSSQSDVWSYGVVLWEIFTLGGSPYPGITTDEFLSYLRGKKRMNQPESCPNEFYTLMTNCWEDDPDNRPTFSEIYDRVGNLIETLTDTNATYLRLESLETPSTKPEAVDGTIQSPVITNAHIECSEDAESTPLDFCNSNSEEDKAKGYQNLTSDVLQDKRTGSPTEYVAMSNGPFGDVNENMIDRTKDVHHPLL